MSSWRCLCSPRVSRYLPSYDNKAESLAFRLFYIEKHLQTSNAFSCVIVKRHSLHVKGIPCMNNLHISIPQVAYFFSQSFSRRSIAPTTRCVFHLLYRKLQKSNKAPAYNNRQTMWNPRKCVFEYTGEKLVAQPFNCIGRILVLLAQSRILRS